MMSVEDETVQNAELKVVGIEQPPFLMQFHTSDNPPRVVFSITNEGRFELGDGWTDQDAAKHFVDGVNAMFEAQGIYTQLSRANAVLCEKVRNLEAELAESDSILEGRSSF